MLQCNITPEQPTAVLFDAYGTLLDVHSVSALAEAYFPTQGAAISQLWRDKQIEYTRLVSVSVDRREGKSARPYQDFWALTQAALRYSAKRLGLTMGISEENALMAQYEQLKAHEGALEVLQTLKQQGFTTGILSNGSPAMLEAVVRNAGLTPYLDHIISVDTVQLYKTHPEAYALGEQATGLPATRIGFVSANSWDALAATWYGYKTIWINRQNMPFEELGTPPVSQVHRLLDVLHCLPS